MKITLAFTIFNKEKWIKSLLRSWVSNLSGKNIYEIIIVFDACKDRSEKIAEEYLRKNGIKYKFLHANDKYEIFCNNLALKHATGDYIIFIQDDNWIYDKNWDVILTGIINKYSNVGAIGLLAGLKYENSLLERILSTLSIYKLFGISPTIKYKRIEFNSKHKGIFFYGFKDEKFTSGIFQVDSVIRPFAVSVDLLKRMGGLDKTFMPMDGDDMDLCIKLLKKGKKNILVPLDLVNTTSKHETLKDELIRENYLRAMSILSKRHFGYLVQRKTIMKKLMSYPKIMK